MKNNKTINKVICIGMHKTGTTSLGLALLDLGYIVLGARVDLGDVLLQGKLDQVLQVSDSYSALQDVPWALLYKELDQKYPHSRFILTEREESKWIKSVLNHFGNSYTSMREWIYGDGIVYGNEDIYLAKYRQHYKEVKDYFKKRPEDLLVISLSDGDSWQKICEFLGHEIPNKKFPVANKGNHNLAFFEKFYGFIRDSIPVGTRRIILNILGKSDKRNRFNNHGINKAYRDSIKEK